MLNTFGYARHYAPTTAFPFQFLECADSYASSSAADARGHQELVHLVETFSGPDSPPFSPEPPTTSG